MAYSDEVVVFEEAHSFSRSGRNEIGAQDHVSSQLPRSQCDFQVMGTITVRSLFGPTFNPTIESKRGGGGCIPGRTIWRRWKRMFHISLAPRP
jgi:hypothetical protein